MGHIQKAQEIVTLSYLMETYDRLYALVNPDEDTELSIKPDDYLDYLIERSDDMIIANGTFEEAMRQLYDEVDYLLKRLENKGGVAVVVIDTAKQVDTTEDTIYKPGKAVYVARLDNSRSTAEIGWTGRVTMFDKVDDTYRIREFGTDKTFWVHKDDIEVVTHSVELETM